MGLLTFAKVYGLSNNKIGRQIAKEMAASMVEEFKAKHSNLSTSEAQILFDDRLDERPGFRLKVTCRSSRALAELLDLPLASGRRGRTVGGRDAFVIDLRGASEDTEAVQATEAPAVEAAPTPAVEVSPAPAPVTPVEAVATESAPSPAPAVEVGTPA